MPDRPTLKRQTVLTLAGALLLQSPAQAEQSTVDLAPQSLVSLPAEVTSVVLLEDRNGLCDQTKSWHFDLEKRELWTRGCAGRFGLSRPPPIAAAEPAPEAGAGEVVGAVLALAAIAGIAAIASSHDQNERDPRPDYPDPDDGPDHRPPGPAGAYAGRGLIRGPAGLCLGIRDRGNGLAQGAPAVLERCDGRKDQRFAWTERGELRVAGYCLDAAGGATHNNTQLIAWRCNGGRNQKWFVDGQRIRGEQSGKCLDVRGNRLQAGTPVVLYQCHGGMNQRWTDGYYPNHRPPTSPLERSLIRGPGGLCLGIRDRAKGVDQGAPAVLERCDGRRDQRFAWSERGELRVAGYCLDAAGGGTHNNTQLIAWRCNGGRNQKWFVDGQRIRGEQSGKCLAVQDRRDHAGAPVVLYQCHGGANQRWAW